MSFKVTGLFYLLVGFVIVRIVSTASVVHPGNSTIIPFENIKDVEWKIVHLPQAKANLLLGPESKQTPPATAAVGAFPCSCKSGECSCCTGMWLAQFQQKGCMKLVYVPEEFAFEMRMTMNGNVLYKNSISGKNPPPVCIRVPRIRFIQMCATFSNVYFKGRNMHTCIEMDANFEGFELFHRDLNCFMIGAQGFRLLRPEEGGGGGGAVSTSQNVDDDDDDDDIEDYDENLLRSNINSTLFQTIP